MDATSPNRGKSKVQVDGFSSPKQFRWTYEMECCFLDLLLHEERIGNRVGGTFSSQAYRNILNELHGSYGTVIQKNHLRNKIRSMKQSYGEFKDAFRGMSGFSWNWVTKKFDAETDVWEALIQENPRAAGLRGKSCVHWERMNILWGSSRASGNRSATVSNMRARLDAQAREEGSHHVSFEQTEEAVNDVSATPIFGTTSTYMSIPDDSGHQPASTSGRSTGKRKASMDSSSGTDIRLLASSMKDLSRDMIECASKMTNIITRPHPPATDLFFALSTLDLSDEYLMECYEYLANNDAKAEMFLGTSQRLRSMCLKRIMNSK